AGVQRVDVVGGRPIAMRIWIDPDRLAALNLAPGDVHAALQRNNYLAAVGQTKGDLVQVNLLANTDLRTTDEFKNLVVAERNGAIVRLSDVARVELGAEEADFITKFSDKEAVYMGVWPLPGSNEIEVANRLHAEPPPHPRDRAVGGIGGGRRHRGGRKRRAARARGQDTDPGGARGRARAGRPYHRDDDHARGGIHAHRVPGRAHRLLVPGVRDHPRRRRRRFGSRGGDAVPGDELALRPRSG